MKQILFNFLILSSLISSINTQQEYSGNSVLSCKNSDQTKPSPAFLYTCHGENPSCPTFLIFKSEPPYNSLPSISALTSSKPSYLAQINKVTEFSLFPTGKEVIVPINCSCSGHYYRANTTYRIPTIHETYFTIANNTYQGLSTCDSLKRANHYGEFDLHPGIELDVPLRCACPTKKQAEKGTKFLLTYSLNWDDSTPDLAQRFGASENSILNANGFSETNPTLFPFTTILIPLPNEPPLSSETVIHPKKPDISVPPPPNHTKGKKSEAKVYEIIAGSVLLILIFVSFGSCVFYKKKTSRVSWAHSEGKRIQAIQRDLRVEIASIDQDLRLFKFEELKKATDNFSSKNRIKGSVYKGFFRGETVAVKQMGTNESEEVSILNKINHFNLVKLDGICQHHGYFYLIFEYMENRSLREWLDNKYSIEREIWHRRIQIALDIANGLHYLHSFAKPACVHKDLTSRNILLDRNLRAKIANFSLARTAQKGLNSNLTSQVTGTRGYLAPEYVRKGQVGPQIDVYAFGVVLLELITGKDAGIIIEGREVLLSAAMALSVGGEHAEAELSEFIDPGITEDRGIEYAARVAKLSLSCLGHDPGSRPRMAGVVSVLSKIQIELEDQIHEDDESLSFEKIIIKIDE